MTRQLLRIQMQLSSTTSSSNATLIHHPLTRTPLILIETAILLAVLNIIPLGMLIVGIINLSNCRIEPYIPIWLIVTGVFSLLKSATNFFYRARRQRLQQQQQQPSAIPSNINPNPFDG
ncbi:unnamed protein product, partial [Anisakis simplex]|uniref:Uncharacterized protein n=1 Tax=Anisakis simplex TaxID=6269 RepID=A0A0M3K8Q2_ANISI